MRRFLLALGGLLVLLSACGAPPAHRTTTPTTGPLPPTGSTPAVSTTTTTTVPDTAVVPARITVAYVDAVFAKLDAVYGNAVRSVKQATTITRAAEDDLAAIYTSRLDLTELQAFVQVLGDGSPNVRKHPGNMTTLVQKLVHARSNCIFARVKVDDNAVTVKPTAMPADVWEGLKPRDKDDGPQGLNPTPWVIFYELSTTQRDHIPDQCAS